ncbi:prefoldin subunit alpha [Candidatus Woesearchaeota archaeon]|nr:prefoldin subunit alpha [Candidatus Woesearchaeota archaeon]
MNEKKELYLEYQLLTKEVQEMENTIVNINEHIITLKNLKDNLIELKKIKKNTETLIPLGKGVFFKGSFSDANNVIMNIGANICIEKTNIEAQKTIEEQMRELLVFVDNIDKELSNSFQKLNELEERLR